jgi:hypothetical protein
LRQLIKGYKAEEPTPETFEKRRAIVAFLAGELDPPGGLQEVLADSDHEIDVVVCVLAGYDYLQGAVKPPTDRTVAEREGFIWFRSGND